MNRRIAIFIAVAAIMALIIVTVGDMADRLRVDVPPAANPPAPVVVRFEK